MCGSPRPGFDIKKTRTDTMGACQPILRIIYRSHTEALVMLKLQRQRQKKELAECLYHMLEQRVLERV